MTATVVPPAPSLRFHAASHRYRLDGRSIRGVTGLIGGGIPKPALVGWAARTVAEFVADHEDDVQALRALGRGPMVAALKETPYQQRDEASIRGVDIHKLAEQVIHGHDVDVPEHYLPWLQGYIEFLDRWQVEPVLTERPVAHRAIWYAGTFDAIVRFGRGPYAGKLVGLDLKTSRSVYGETALQIAAYMRAEFYLSEDDQELPLPAVDATAVVHLTEIGSFCHPLSDDPAAIDAAFLLFRHAAHIARNKDTIAGFVRPPIEDQENPE